MSAARRNGNDVRTFDPAIAVEEFQALREAFPIEHFNDLFDERFPFYRTTFWFPMDREPENAFERTARILKDLANPTSEVTGVEWWFSVVEINATPQWLLPCHFDRADIGDKDEGSARNPEFASVFFLNAVPYGELVVTDQVLTEKGRRPRQPKAMDFILPKENLYAVFPGHLYHGVIGRMWRPFEEGGLRMSMAVNYWNEKPSADYLLDSREALKAFELD